MLTARSSVLDVVLGLEFGAADYLTKPFSMRELQARVTTVLPRIELMREASRTQKGADEPVLHAGLRIGPASREVESGDQPVMLTPKEFDLLYLLASNSGRVFSRDYVLDRLWGRDYGGFDRTVDTPILRLRRKLSAGSDAIAERIVTLSGVGCKYERPTAPSDRTRVRQILNNLLYIALRHTPEGGLNFVDAEARETAIAVSVTDTGVGIPVEELETIFEWFYHGGQGNGSGLGLHIVRQLVEAQQGSVSADSQPGIGTTFCFTLPLAR